MSLLILAIKRAKPAIVYKTAIGQVVLLCLHPLSLREVVLILKPLDRLRLDGRLHNIGTVVILLAIVEAMSRWKLVPVSGHKILLIQIWRQNICRDTWTTLIVDDSCLIRLMVMDLGDILRAYLSVCVVSKVAYVDMGLELRVVIVLPIEA